MNQMDPMSPDPQAHVPACGADHGMRPAQEHAPMHQEAMASAQDAAAGAPFDAQAAATGTPPMIQVASAMRRGGPQD
jgi:hypothetical protein